MNRPVIIAIDFDGCVVTHRYPQIGQMLGQARYIINKLYDEGYFIIIWTCRGGVDLVNAINWMDEFGIKYHNINENAPYDMIHFKPAPKIYADVYIDDRNLQGFPGWEKAYEIINKQYGNTDL